MNYEKSKKKHSKKIRIVYYYTLKVAAE